MYYISITKHGSALYIGMAKVLPIIDVLGYDGQNSSFSYYVSTLPSCRITSVTSRFSARVDYSGTIQYLEHVVVTMSISIPSNTVRLSRGDIEIKLLSPSQTESILLQPRQYDSTPGDYSDWPFMSVMFWGEDPTGEWTLNITTRHITDVAIVSNVEFTFYGVSSTPEAVANIPDSCHSNCRRGCAGEGSDLCDSCVNLRNAYTLECINECPPGYTERSGYCYNASLPLKHCNSPLKNKKGSGFFSGYEKVNCTVAGFTECCTSGDCNSAPFHPSKCFCDSLCYKFNDCCEDVALIGCREENGIVLLIISFDLF